MIKAYLTCITMYTEGEDIEIRYNIFKDDDLIKEESFFKEYHKPALCELVALEELLKELEDYKEDEILIIINDNPMFDLLKGRDRSNNPEVDRLVAKLRRKLQAFSNLSLDNVDGDHLKTQEWNNILSR